MAACTEESEQEAGFYGLGCCPFIRRLELPHRTGRRYTEGDRSYRMNTTETVLGIPEEVIR